MKHIVIIPAQYHSTRLPGKPLKPISGVPMLQRVWAICKSVPEIDEVLFTTDHDEIEGLCRSIGAECVRTGDVRNGTERVAAALTKFDTPPDVVVNVQADAVLTTPWAIQAVLPVFSDDSVVMATPATLMDEDAYKILVKAKQSGEVGGTTVVFDLHGDALYFSKSPIPYVREGTATAKVYRHIGLYAYRPHILKRLIELAPGPLEVQEQLEQLRALECGIKIRVVPVDYHNRTHWGVDSEQDQKRAEILIAEEGDLLPKYDGTYRIKATV